MTPYAHEAEPEGGVNAKSMGARKAIEGVLFQPKCACSQLFGI